MGCYETPAYTTSDGLYAVVFKYHNGVEEVATNMSVPAGVIPAAQGMHSYLEVVCPAGYRVHETGERSLFRYCEHGCGELSWAERLF